MQTLFMIKIYVYRNRSPIFKKNQKNSTYGLKTIRYAGTVLCNNMSHLVRNKPYRKTFAKSANEHDILAYN